ncbi:down syndrome cell adhesion molecule-like protein 1 [Caerostris extrusa]|uniref:Down syndrome cell adhesion molecule-like protein 1 n=1 Tax=Caerostris extrusa TaxID=172846 RepID=A0AAV4Y2L0_CAEEX|nr:down syndrome cell adhesion molecule-like protein 1 [Caerostris extrusa]
MHCKNAFWIDRHTANLAVSAPPVWLNEPMDVLAKEGDLVTIPCQATGVPQPTITWTTVKGKIENSSELTALMKYDSTGTLTISRADASLKGSYNCIADNGFGTAIRKTIHLSIQGKRFDSPRQKIFEVC